MKRPTFFSLRWFVILIAAAIGFLFLPKTSFAAKQFQVDSSGTLTTGLVSYWPLEGNSNDFYGSNNGTDTDMQYGSTYGKVNQGARPSTGATGNGIDVGSDSSLAPAGDYSINAWVYLTASGGSASDFNIILSRGQSSNPYERYALFEYGGTWCFATRDSFGNDYRPCEASAGINQWQMITAIVSGTSVNLYVNTTAATPVTATGTRASIGSDSWIVGGWAEGGTNALQERVDEVGFWNKALSAQEITDLYNGGNGQTMILGGPRLDSPLQQYQSDATTTIAAGGTTTSSTVVFGAKLNSSGTSTLQLQVEVQPAGTSFTNVANATSSYVSPGGYVTATTTGLSAGDYHWQARVMENGTGVTSTWQLFGSSSSSIDFRYSPATRPQFQIDTNGTLTTNFVSYWPMEGNSADFYGTSSSTDTNMQYGSTYGKVNQGARPSTGASGNGIDLGSNAAFIPTGDYSVNAWAYLTATGASASDFNIVFSRGQATSPYEQYALFEYDGTWCFATRDAVGNDHRPCATSLGTNQWQMVTGVVSGTSVKLYVNDVSSTPATFSGSRPTITGDAWITGGYAEGGTNALQEYIDEVGFWNKALSEQEIKDLYNNGNGQTMVTSGSPYYAQLENTSTLSLRDGSSTSANVLKTLPAGWIIQVVSSTDPSGSPMIAGGYHWFKVADPTDSVIGWMAASDTTSQYISSYDGSAQGAMTASSSNLLSTTTTPTRANVILQAIDNYYDNTNSSSSLYNSNDSSTNDGTNDLSIFKSRGLPESLIWGIAALESGGVSFDNEYIHYDYGHGIMQITPVPLFYDEPTSTGGPWDWADNAPMPSNGSFIKIYPCAMGATTTYVNCYTHSGVQDSTDNKSYKDYGYSNVSTTYKYYTNTAQSIYANVKDGMRILQNKLQTWFPSPVTTSTVASGTTYSATDREAIIATAAYYGNPLASSTCTYVDDVADRLDNITSYFPAADTSTVSSTEVSQMHTAGEDTVCAQLHSPGNLVIEDSQGREVGIVDGKGVNDFPLALYNSNGKQVEILAAGNDNYTYKVVGTGAGEYGIDIVLKDGARRIIVQGRNIPITSGEVHSYSIDKNAILNNQGGVTLSIDSAGNGKINEVDKLGAMPAGSNFEVQAVEAVPFVPPPLPPAPTPQPVLPITPPIFIAPTSTFENNITTSVVSSTSPLINSSTSAFTSSTTTSSTSSNE